MWDRALDDLRPEIERAYDEIWQRMFAETGQTKAKLSIIESSEDSGHREEADEIILAVTEWGIQEVDNEDPRHWPRWRGELVHEVAHEYAAKMKPPVSETGRRLHNEHPPFAGHGHDERFWSAVEAIARELNLDLSLVAKAI